MVLALLLPVCGFTAVYKWTDQQGNTHFSDSPNKGAEKITLPEAQTYSPVTLPSPAQKPQSNYQQEKKPSYQSVAVVQPGNEATIRNNNGYIAVSIKANPALFEGDAYQLYFDNQAVGKPQTSTVFVLNNVYRGEHSLFVAVVNSQGKQLIKSPSVTIFMHRAHVGGA